MPKGKVEIDAMNPESRVWIYQANRPLGLTESTQIRKDVSEFVKEWKAHGNELMAGCTVLKHQFLIIALDESFSEASGCSIDSCVRKIQQVGGQYLVDFFDRTIVATQNDENEIVLVPMNEISEAISDGRINESTLVFNNTIQKLSELKSEWLKPAKESWIKRYFK